jgi:arginase
MSADLTLIGAPSSAGAYAPGQEKAPAALRAAGLATSLESAGRRVTDLGDVAGFRWRVDRDRPRAMNIGQTAAVACSVAERAACAFAQGAKLLVLGGDCTIELGTVAAALGTRRDFGLVYIDLDTDLNTPESTTDGALDWMGMAHMLGLPQTVPKLTSWAPRNPLLHPHQVFYFGVDNIEPFEQQQIAELGLRSIRLPQVVKDPVRAARRVLDTWGRQFDCLLVHLDLDVLDFVDTQLAENNRRNWGLTFEQLMAALHVFVQEPRWSALTICELNPDHTESDGSTIRSFVQALAGILTPSPNCRRAAPSCATALD